MTVFEMIPEDIEWPEPNAPRAPYIPQAETKEQARGLYLEQLAEVNEAIKGLQERRPELVVLAKVNGATWEEIGDVLGTSRQAACRTYGEKIEA